MALPGCLPIYPPLSYGMAPFIVAFHLSDEVPAITSAPFFPDDVLESLFAHCVPFQYT